VAGQPSGAVRVSKIFRRLPPPPVRFGLLVALVLTLGAFTVFARPDREALLESVRDSGVFGPAAAVLGSALLVAALVPRTLLALVGGALFGTLGGAGYVVIGVTAGSVLAYGVGRMLGREFVAGRLRGRLAVLEAAVARRGTWAVMVMRMIPLVPFCVSNYALGTTSVRLRQFIGGTALGIVPNTLAYAALGSAAMHGNWTGAKVAAACAMTLSATGCLGTLLVWRRRPRSTDAQGSATQPATVEPAAAQPVRG
jgi:uncharacterized membrane protein YdjX (TVP38/TMEM64 family)